MPPAFAALTALRLLAGVLSLLVFVIQLRLPNKNRFVAGLGLTIALFNFLRVVFTLLFGTTAALQANAHACWSNFVVGVYLNNAEHLMALGVTVQLWCMVRHSLALERHEQRSLVAALLFPVALVLAMVWGVEHDHAAHPLENPGVVALRVDKCFMVGPAWAAWVGLLGVNFGSSILILVLSVHTIFKIIGTVRKTSHVLQAQQKGDEAGLDPEDMRAVISRKYSNASQVIPPKFYARILVLLVFCLVYSLISTITIAIKVHEHEAGNGAPSGPRPRPLPPLAAEIISPSAPSAETYDADHFVECADFLGAADGVIVFLIFGSSSEAIRHFWAPLRENISAFFASLVGLLFGCCGWSQRRRSSVAQGSPLGNRPSGFSAVGDDDRAALLPKPAAPAAASDPNDREFLDFFDFVHPLQGRPTVSLTRPAPPSFVNMAKAGYARSPPRPPARRGSGGLCILDPPARSPSLHVSVPGAPASSGASGSGQTTGDSGDASPALNASLRAYRYPAVSPATETDSDARSVSPADPAFCNIVFAPPSLSTIYESDDDDQADDPQLRELGFVGPRWPRRTPAVFPR